MTIAVHNEVVKYFLSTTQFPLKIINKQDSPTTTPATTPKSNTPFRRVIEEDVVVDPRLQDNSFDAKVSATELKFKFNRSSLLVQFSVEDY